MKANAVLLWLYKVLLAAIISMLKGLLNVEQSCLLDIVPLSIQAQAYDPR